MKNTYRFQQLEDRGEIISPNEWQNLPLQLLLQFWEMVIMVRF